jgi:hypothetical protein
MFFTIISVAEAGSISVTIRINAVVPAHADLNIIKQQNVLVVTDADVRRGFVLVPEASVLELKNNSRSGCLLEIEAQGLPYREAAVSIMGKEVVVGPNGGFVPLQVTGKATASMQVKFVLAEGTQAGTYAWPFVLSVSPI